jgi:hypothetical protein
MMLIKVRRGELLPCQSGNSGVGVECRDQRSGESQFRYPVRSPGMPLGGEGPTVLTSLVSRLCHSSRTWSAGLGSLASRILHFGMKSALPWSRAEGLGCKAFRIVP